MNQPVSWVSPVTQMMILPARIEKNQLKQVNKKQDLQRKELLLSFLKIPNILIIFYE